MTPSQLEPITYGDVFNVHGELAEKPVTPRDASMMQRAETALLGHTQRGGAAALMQSAASWNARSGVFPDKGGGRRSGGDGFPDEVCHSYIVLSQSTVPSTSNVSVI